MLKKRFFFDQIHSFISSSQSTMILSMSTFFCSSCNRLAISRRTSFSITIMIPARDRDGLLKRPFLSLMAIRKIVEFAAMPSFFQTSVGVMTRSVLSCSGTTRAQCSSRRFAHRESSADDSLYELATFLDHFHYRTKANCAMNN